jgi:hypothetical protein
MLDPVYEAYHKIFLESPPVPRCRNAVVFFLQMMYIFIVNTPTMHKNNLKKRGRL